MVFFIALLASCSACVMCFFSHRVFCSALPCSIFGSCHSEIFVLLRTGVSFTSSSQVFQACKNFSQILLTSDLIWLNC
ncbi:hypothetical protein Ahy_B04g072043 isoform A [Arachis hypogaea]|uniref:Secreted protein n=1 Tax=Arachis hypogaea TaxID=3818 RepID=A0A444ZMB2_ARAHY|nr:hypothetical protein Ahy_B04g072043 isoform A [Arachis hypogaea]